MWNIQRDSWLTETALWSERDTQWRKSSSEWEDILWFHTEVWKKGYSNPVMDSALRINQAPIDTLNTIPKLNTAAYVDCCFCTAGWLVSRHGLKAHLQWLVLFSFTQQITPSFISCSSGTVCFYLFACLSLPCGFGVMSLSVTLSISPSNLVLIMQIFSDQLPK